MAAVDSLGTDTLEPLLPAGRAHVWWRRWCEVQPRPDLLDAREHGRLNGFRRAEDARRFLAGDIVLRSAAAMAEGCTLDEVRVARTCNRCGGPHGAPRLVGSTWRVSVTHSGAWIGVALARRPAGIDVEAPPGLERVSGLTDFVLGASAHAEPGPAQLLRTWVRKEAALKAWGVGLLAPMHRVTVTDGSRPECWTARLGAMPEVGGVDLLSPQKGYPAAVAVVGPVGPEVMTH